MQYVYNDGGRSAAGYKGSAGDCVCRAVAIAAELPYQDVYNILANGNLNERMTKRTSRSSGKRSARNGIYTKRKWFDDYMQSLGFKWVPTMKIGQGCKVHLADGELPMGRLIVSVSRHLCAVIDGVLHDTHCDDRGGKRCVYGYYIKQPA
jgi:hypothetical protein